jgi:hypothetical protein
MEITPFQLLHVFRTYERQQAGPGPLPPAPADLLRSEPYEVILSAEGKRRQIEDLVRDRVVQRLRGRPLDPEGRAEARRVLDEILEDIGGRGLGDEDRARLREAGLSALRQA